LIKPLERIYNRTAVKLAVKKLRLPLFSPPGFNGLFGQQQQQKGEEDDLLFSSAIHSTFFTFFRVPPLD
jgi:hypothetical protein